MASSLRQTHANTLRHNAYSGVEYLFFLRIPNWLLFVAMSSRKGGGEEVVEDKSMLRACEGTGTVWGEER